jgi:cytochrome P450
MFMYVADFCMLACHMLQFQPERWSEEHAEKDPVTGAARWVPFSLGPKACAGQNLALLQSKAHLAMLLAGYQWSLAPSMG